MWAVAKETMDAMLMISCFCFVVASPLYLAYEGISALSSYASQGGDDEEKNPVTTILFRPIRLFSSIDWPVDYRHPELSQDFHWPDGKLPEINWKHLW